MKYSVNHPAYGAITYEENIWTGAKTITVGGTLLVKRDKKAFFLPKGESGILVTVSGSEMLGVTLHIGSEQISVCPKPAWYDWILAMIPLMLNLVWGNSLELCRIVPVVGGAIGGAINGAAIAVLISMMRGKRLGGKLLTALLGTVVCFGACAVLARLILSV